MLLIDLLTASQYQGLEGDIEDQKIEDSLMELDDPRRPIDLRRYEQLNAMQDESMAQLQR